MPYQPTTSAPARIHRAGPELGSEVERDDTTRYLCAAAHLDQGYANEAIREFLVEETRPVPPSPGVDAATVLGEAVAARTRRKLRDGALVLLVILFGWIDPFSLFIWVVLALLAVLAGAVSSGKVSLRRYIPTLVVVGGLALLLLLTPVGRLLGLLLGFGSSSSGSVDSSDLPPGYYLPPEDLGPSVESILAIVLIGLMLAVLLADRFVVWNLLTVQFRKNPTSRPTGTLDTARYVYTFSGRRFLRQLGRFVDPPRTMAPSSPAPTGMHQDNSSLDGALPVIVHRGYNPFVGAGEHFRPWSVAVPLERLSDAPAKGKLTTEAVYERIRSELQGLHQATMLSPSRRLRRLTINEQIIVSAAELVDHLAEPAARDFLQNTGVPPYALLHREHAQSIRACPLEWARYYHCIQVETWDRDLVVSVYLHVAVDESTLYVEWTPCLLRPIKGKYQQIDTMSRSPLLPIGQSLFDLIRLPALAPLKLWHTLVLIRPIRRDRDVIDPDMFGTLRSLREMAADKTVHNYFQLADRDRYLKMFQGRFVLAISRIMREAGYSSASFDRMAATVVNNNVHIGTNTGLVQAGLSNEAGDVTAAPGASSTTSPTPQPN